MKKSLYDVLQVSKIADQDVIEVAYQRLFQKTQSDGSQDSQNQAKFIQHAYEVLSDQDQRALYDKSLLNQDNLHRQSAFQPSHYRSDFADASDGWWKSPIVTGTIVLISALIGFNLFTGHTGEKNKVEIVKQSETTKRQANELNAANVSKHLDNEETLVKGVVDNKYKYIDESAKIDNRVIDIAQQAENTRRTELEYRANAGAQKLEMERREQDARLEMQRKQQANNEQRMKEQTAENARRYYSCMNAAIDRYGADRAPSMCQRY